MKKTKFLVLLIMLVLLVIFVPKVNAIDVWGVSRGTTRVYYFDEGYSGNITGVSEYPALQYQILSQRDTDANNKTDLALRVTSLTGTLNYDQSSTSLDSKYMVQGMVGLEYTLFNFNDIDDLNTLFTTYGLAGGFILPVKGNQTFAVFMINLTVYIIWPWGINWTRAFTEINARPNYDCAWQGNRLVINATKYNQLDASNNLRYNLTKVIEWDRNTGFLITAAYNRTYQNGLYSRFFNLSAQYTFIPLESPKGAQITLADIFWPIAIGVCGVAVALSAYLYKKR